MEKIPDTARAAALIGDRVRANMRLALIQRAARMVSELSAKAGVGGATTSFHVAQILAGVILTRISGRQKYLEPASADVAAVLEQQLLQSLSRHGYLVAGQTGLQLSLAGFGFAQALGITQNDLRSGPPCAATVWIGVCVKPILRGVWGGRCWRRWKPRAGCGEIRRRAH